MSGIRSYDLSGDQVKALHTALLGDETERLYWLQKFANWLNYRDRQMEILRHAEQWFKDYAVRTKIEWHDDWRTEEEQLMDWVHYQMEYASGLCWDRENKKVIVNKYASSKPLLSQDNTNKLLDYITQQIKSGEKNET